MYVIMFYCVWLVDRYALVSYNFRSLGLGKEIKEEGGGLSRENAT